MESITQLWSLVCQEYKKDANYSEIAFSLWIECIEPKSFEDTTLITMVKTSLQKQIIEKHYLSALNNCLTNIMGFETKIEITLEDELPQKTENNKENSCSLQGEKSINVNEEYTFDNFIIGDSNKFANAACHAVALNPAGAYNPLFVYGNSGLGKTHLLFAICNEIKKNDPDANIIYIKCEKFINDFISSISSKTTLEFQEKYRNADILLVDDIQFLTQKERTQEEFFHTFNALYHAGKQIVLTSDRPPKEISTLEDRLRTRFESGLIADVQPPDFETRVAIINKKAKSLDIDISDDIAQYLANKLKSNIRQIEGAVIKLAALVNLGGVKPSITVV
ncbi:MAG: chromosomal replication initiator protein DnaA, partial [Clostridia bacterium]